MPFIRWTRRVLVLVTLLAFTATCFAVRPTETILCTFTGGADGGGPCCVVADAAGNLYGEIGMHIDGAIFELYSSGGIWTEKVLYQFQGGNDGSGATGGMIFDASGNLYGTTYAGGGSANCSRGCGTVFELSPPSMPGGSWTETVLYSFEGGPADGASPMGALIFDQGGSLYGMTRWGGGGNCPVNDNTGCGTVFRVTPPSEPGGPWTETVLYSFQGGEDGNAAGGAQNGVIFDSSGNLYGTTYYGGTGCNNFGCGTIFELKPPREPNGAWTGNVLYRFKDDGVDGNNPAASLTIHEGALYGTTSYGGTGYSGIVFALALTNGTLTENILYSFTNYATPDSALVFDHYGSMYGTQGPDGCLFCDGAAFALLPRQR